MSKQELQQQKKQEVLEPSFPTYREAAKYVVENQPDVTMSFDNETYQAYFQNEQQHREISTLLTSDKALEDYYEKNDPEMLTGLRSKSFINFPGKKSERKRLRKAALQKVSVEGQTKKLAEDYRSSIEGGEALSDEEVLEKKKEQQWSELKDYLDVYEGITERDNKQLTDSFEKMGPLRRERYLGFIRKLKDKNIELRKENPSYKELKFVQQTMEGDDLAWVKEVESDYLYKTKDNDKKSFIEKTLRNERFDKHVNKDLYGEDSKDVQAYQTELVHIRNSKLDYKGYRLMRGMRRMDDNVSYPDIIKKELAKGKKSKYTSGDFERTCSKYMRPVNYITDAEGKQIPATEQDVKNNEYNTKWAESLLSDKEEDWTFRFKEMEKHIDALYKKRLSDIENLLKGFDMSDPKNMKLDFDDRKFLDDYEAILRENGKTLILSGVTHGNLKDKSNLFTSKYFLSLSKERQKELSAKADVLTAFNGVIIGIFARNGYDINTYRICTDAEQAKGNVNATGSAMLLKFNMEAMKTL